MDIEFRVNYDKNVNIINWGDYKEEFLYDDYACLYFSSINKMVDCYTIKKWRMPRYVYGCRLNPFSLDVTNMLKSEAHNHHEDIMDNVEGVAELREAIEKFNSANKSNGSYYVDKKTIVDLTELTIDRIKLRYCKEENCPSGKGMLCCNTCDENIECSSKCTQDSDSCTGLIKS